MNNVHLTSNSFEDVSHLGVDIISRTMITTLIAGDRLYTQVNEWTNISFVLYSSYQNRMTALLGFLYSPFRYVPISWWVGRKNEGFLEGELYPVVFDIIFINQGKGWNE